MIINAPINLTNVSNEAVVIFKCEAQGTPLPDITWIFDNLVVSTVSYVTYTS